MFLYVPLLYMGDMPWCPFYIYLDYLYILKKGPFARCTFRISFSSFLAYLGHFIWAEY